MCLKHFSKVVKTNPISIVSFFFVFFDVWVWSPNSLEWETYQSCLNSSKPPKSGELLNSGKRRFNLEKPSTPLKAPQVTETTKKSSKIRRTKSVKITKTLKNQASSKSIQIANNQKLFSEDLEHIQNCSNLLKNSNKRKLLRNSNKRKLLRNIK